MDAFNELRDMLDGGDDDGGPLAADGASAGDPAPSGEANFDEELGDPLCIRSIVHHTLNGFDDPLTLSDIVLFATPHHHRPEQIHRQRVTRNDHLVC